MILIDCDATCQRAERLKDHCRRTGREDREYPPQANLTSTAPSGKRSVAPQRHWLQFHFQERREALSGGRFPAWSDQNPVFLLVGSYDAIER